MNSLMLTLALLLPSTGQAEEKLEIPAQPLAQLNDFEKQVHERCKMVYKHHNIRHNRCDENTFARGVHFINSSVMQLECGYYQLQCKD